MAIRTITLTKVTNPFYPLPKIEFTQGETVTIRLTDSDTDLNNKLITFSIKEGLAIPGTNLSTNPNLIQSNQRILTVSSGFASFTLSNIDTLLLSGNKVYTFQIDVDLGSGTDYIYGTYELRVREGLLATTLDTAPTSISNLVAWYRADVLTGANGSSVSSWTDSSGLGNNATQGTATNQPTLITNNLNSKKVIRFDGSNDFLTTPITADYINFSFITLIKVNNLNTFHLLLNKASKERFYINQNDGALFLVATSGNVSTISNISKINQWQILAVTVQNLTVSIYINGSLIATGNVTTRTNNANPYVIGGSVLDAINGDMAEALIYSKTLTQAEISTICTGLKNFYNL